MVPLWATEGAADMPSPSCGAVIYLCGYVTLGLAAAATSGIGRRPLEVHKKQMPELGRVVTEYGECALRCSGLT